ncbi:hypothetical protein D3C86_426430 [compost metagenome]
MRSRRHGLLATMEPKATTTSVAITKNMRAFTPPRNRMPMAITAITMKAPMSGSAITSMPTTTTAMPIGSTARKKRSLISILRTM